jgi:hypothetical protein
MAARIARARSLYSDQRCAVIGPSENPRVVATPGDPTTPDFQVVQLGLDVTFDRLLLCEGTGRHCLVVLYAP